MGRQCIEIKQFQGTSPYTSWQGPPHSWQEEPVRDDFDASSLNINFQSLRNLLTSPGFPFRNIRDGYACVTADEEGRRILGLVVSDNIVFTKTQMILDKMGLVHMQTKLDHARLQFSWSWNGRNWTDIGLILDSTIPTNTGTAPVSPVRFSAFAIRTCQK